MNSELDNVNVSKPNNVHPNEQVEANIYDMNHSRALILSVKIPKNLLLFIILTKKN
jgi:hypothetical protein